MEKLNKIEKSGIYEEVRFKVKLKMSRKQSVQGRGEVEGGGLTKQ